MPDLLTYWHTLRHLRPIQFYGRLRLHLPSTGPVAGVTPPVRATSGAWAEPARRRESMVGPSHFRFLNETHEVNGDWELAHLEKLWRYNLHYFDDLNAAQAAARSTWHQAVLLRWLNDNPAGKGTAWEPYPTSLRIVNWIKWSLAGNPLPPECLASLAMQTRWLHKRLEIHLLGNHLFANAKALIFAGLFFDGPEAATWLEKGMRVLDSEMPEQILADGGQFERSPMYHALALEDMLDLWNVAQTFQSSVPTRWRSNVADWPGRIDDMRAWLNAMCHPDGELSFFNDAALGIAPSPTELHAYAKRLQLSATTGSAQGLQQLPASGYVRVDRSNVVAIIDVGPVGPDYLPGHAHADTLSFELSLGGQRVLVNSGTSCYGISRERLRQRGTAAHNTVVVDGQDSSEVWSGFRVGRRAQPLGLSARDDGRGVSVRCGHDGYQRLAGKVTHIREWHIEPGSIIVDDSLSGKFHSAQARFHLHPSVVVTDGPHDASRSDNVQLRMPDGQQLCIKVDGGTIAVEESTWHPEFGRVEQSKCLVATFAGPTLRTQLTWVAQR